jgi:hypothetical protein
MNTTPSPSSTVTDMIIQGIVDTVATFAGSNPIAAALLDIVPPLVRYVEKRIEGGQDPRAELFSIILAQADATADAVENAKFGPEQSTKPSIKPQ